MSWKLPIPDWVRQYGYIKWTADDDEEAEAFLGSRQEIDLWFEGEYLGEKSIDWQHRRISISRKLTRKIDPDASNYLIVAEDDGVHVRCE